MIDRRFTYISSWICRWYCSVNFYPFAKSTFPGSLFYHCLIHITLRKIEWLKGFLRLKYKPVSNLRFVSQESVARRVWKRKNEVGWYQLTLHWVGFFYSTSWLSRLFVLNKYLNFILFPVNNHLFIMIDLFVGTFLANLLLCSLCIRLHSL